MGTFTQEDVLRAASVVLQDTSNKRWKLTDLNSYLNAATRQIAIHKPNAVEERLTITLVSGAVQKLPDTHSAIVRALRNENGATITTVERQMLDEMMPGWMDTGVVPESASVEHMIYDIATPDEFLVYPPTLANKNIEVSAILIPVSLAPGNDPFDVSTYTFTVQVPGIYQQAVTDYVLFRAYSMDVDLPGVGQRAAFHQQEFASALGIKLQGELAANPKNRHRQG